MGGLAIDFKVTHRVLSVRAALLCGTPEPGEESVLGAVTGTPYSALCVESMARRLSVLSPTDRAAMAQFHRPYAAHPKLAMTSAKKGLSAQESAFDGDCGPPCCLKMVRAVTCCRLPY